MACGDGHAVAGEELGYMEAVIKFGCERDESGKSACGVEQPLGVLQIGGFHSVRGMSTDVAFLGIDEGAFDVNASDDGLCEGVLGAKFDQAAHPLFKIRHRIRNESGQDLIAPVLEQAGAGMMQCLGGEIVPVEVSASVSVYLNVERFHL